jgi:hypothetical protein
MMCEQSVVKAKIRQWHTVRSGWLIIRAGRLEVLRNKFMGGPEEIASFPTTQLSGVKNDPAKYNLQLTFSSPEGKQTTEVFSLVKEKQSEAWESVVNILTRELEARKKLQDEEAARLEKERQEKQRQMRESFSCEVWETSELLWLITQAAYSMVQAVIVADWDEARKQYSLVWQKADRLSNTYNIEITTTLVELDKAVNSRNGEDVIRKAADFIKTLSQCILQIETIWRKWQEQEEVLSGVSPNYNHLPYFLLFSTAYYEVLLSASIEDWTGVNNTIPLLWSSGAVLLSCFAIDLNGFLETANFAAGERNLELLGDTGRHIEDTILESFRTKFFSFELVPSGLPSGNQLSIFPHHLSPNPCPPLEKQPPLFQTPCPLERPKDSGEINRSKEVNNHGTMP